MSSVNRITGMVSGMDTDATVKKLIQLQQNNVDSAKQDKQVYEWQRDQYRDVANSIRSFKDTYFDVLTPETNLKSRTMFNMFSANSSLSGSETSKIAVETTSYSTTGSINITKINQLATKDQYQSATEVKGNIEGVAHILGDINTALSTDTTLSLNLDGHSKEIELEASYADIPTMLTDINTKLKSAFENVDVVMSENAGKLSLNIYERDTVNPEAGHNLKIDGTNADLIAGLGFAAGQTNSVDLGKSITDNLGLSGTLDFELNGISFSFTGDDSVQSVINKVNSSAAGVTMSYDSFSDKFTMASTLEGSVNKISATDTNGLLAGMKVIGGDSTYTGAKDAIFEVDGELSTRSSNKVTINGTEITLKEIHTTGDPLVIDVTSNTSDIKEKLVKFVDEYNKLIEKINSKADEKRYRTFKPLTTEQRSAMKEDEIKIWEEKAKSGLLASDQTLENATRKMRNALNSSVEGVGLTLYDIGIKPSSNYKDKGKLTIDETKLDKSLEERPNEVIELFTKESSISYKDSEDRATRDAQNGLAYKLFDIIEDNIRITRDDNGNQGILLEKAGSTTSEDTDSILAKKIKDMDKRITHLLELLQDKETQYYNQFSRMETAMSRLNSQSQWLASQFGG